MAIRKSGKVVEARDALYAFIEHNPESSKTEDAKNLLGEINTDILLSTMAGAGKADLHRAERRRDQPGRAATGRPPANCIVRANNLQGPMLRIGQKLAISPARILARHQPQDRTR